MRIKCKCELKGEIDIQMGAKPYAFGEIKMKIYRNAVMTDRAFIHYKNIQHISWNYHGDSVEVKIYSGVGNPIINHISSSELDKLVNRYAEFKGVELQ
jgi:hypothetical protein|tara:strand:- start:687 stop:980 length:294 start_codon:yes stop_codon:yes gene_type:complete